MKKSGIIFWCFLVFLFGSCAYEILEELEKDKQCNIVDVSFINEVMPILDANCLRCHVKESTIGGGIVLDNYSDVRFWVESGSLLSVIQHKDGFPPMPKNAAKLTDCEIDQIISWVDDGARNN